MVSQGFTVDLTKPLVFQVGHLGEAYQEWIHQPIVSKEHPRFFDNIILEYMTRTVWWIVPTIWVPVSLWFASSSYKMGYSLPQVAVLVMFGILIWSFMEYTLHRFIFHMPTKTYWANTLHYLLHGCHHKYPMDGLRLVFPPAGTAMLTYLFWNLFKLFGNEAMTPAVFGGAILGYVIYDCTHYYVHHGKPSKQPVKELKRYHLSHHYRNDNAGFGITSKLWDFVFGTLPSKPTTSEKSS